MTEQDRETKIRTLFSLVAQSKVFYLVGKDRFAEIPPKLKGFTSYANEELLSAIGSPVLRARGEIFIFTSESLFFRGVACLREREHMAEYELASISSPPTLLLKNSMAMKPETIHINYGAQDAVELKQQDFLLIERVSLLTPVAVCAKVAVLQDRRGYGIEMSLDDEEKRYAICFLSEDDSVKTVEGFQEEFPGCRVANEKTSGVIKGVAASPLAGILVNPASDYQLTLDKSDLELLEIGISVATGGGFLNRLKQNLFGRPQD